MAIPVDVSGDDGIAAAERLTQLALRMAKVLNADEGEVLIACDASFSVDQAEVDDVADDRGPLREIGDHVPPNARSAALEKCQKAEGISIGPAGKDIAPT